MILAEKYRTKGPWEIEWSIYVDNITDVPKIEENKLVFKVRQVSYAIKICFFFYDSIHIDRFHAGRTSFELFLPG